MKIGSRVIVFTFFEFFNKGIQFILLPILTRYLSPQEFGYIGTFQSLIVFSAIFVGLSGHGAIDANYFNLSKKRIAIYISNVFFGCITSSLIGLFSIIVFNVQIEKLTGLNLSWQIGFLIVAVAQFITLVNLTLWVLEKQPFKYGFYQFSQTILFASVSITLVVLCEVGWIGHVSALIISATIFGIISLYVLNKRGYLTFKYKKLYIKDYLHFGLPMIPHQFADWARNQSDKIIVTYYLGVASTGLFVVGQQAALVFYVFVVALNRALYPLLFEKLSSEQPNIYYIGIVRITYLIAAVMTFFYALYTFLVPFVYEWFLDEKYEDSVFITKILLLAYLFDSFYYLFVNYLFYTKKTQYLARITFSIAILHISISISCVSILSLPVAYVAYSMAICSFLQFIMVWIFANKFYPMPWALNFIKDRS